MWLVGQLLIHRNEVGEGDLDGQREECSIYIVYKHHNKCNSS